MFSVGPAELILILIVALVVVGPEKLPELARMIGRAVRDLRKYADDIRDEFERDVLTNDVKRDLESFTQDRLDYYPYRHDSGTGTEQQPYPYETQEAQQEHPVESQPDVKPEEGAEKSEGEQSGGPNAPPPDEYPQD